MVGDGVRVYVVFENVMYEGSEVKGVYTNKQAANEHFMFLQDQEEPGYVYPSIEEWDAKDSFDEKDRG